jgi:hypothetical protein
MKLSLRDNLYWANAGPVLSLNANFRNPWSTPKVRGKRVAGRSSE